MIQDLADTFAEIARTERLCQNLELPIGGRAIEAIGVARGQQHRKARLDLSGLFRELQPVHARA